MIPMNRTLLIAAGAVGAIAVLAAGVTAFVGLGSYDIGADDHHTKMVLAIIEQLRERSLILKRSRPVQSGMPRFARSVILRREFQSRYCVPVCILILPISRSRRLTMRNTLSGSSSTALK
jgi:hypothetical protein